MDVAARAEELARGAAEDFGLDVLHVEFLGRISPAILRVYIDKPGGVTLDDCQRVSRQLGVLLEVEDLIDSKYVLEVSSPGIERPLFKADDYRRFVSREIRLMAKEKIDERRNFTGHIQDFTDGILTLDCEGRVYRIPYEKIKKAHLVHRFD